MGDGRPYRLADLRHDLLADCAAFLPFLILAEADLPANRHDLLRLLRGNGQRFFHPDHLARIQLGDVRHVANLFTSSLELLGKVVELWPERLSGTCVHRRACWYQSSAIGRNQAVHTATSTSRLLADSSTIRSTTSCGASS